MSGSIILAEYDHDPSVTDKSLQKPVREYIISPKDASTTRTKARQGSNARKWSKHVFAVAPKRILKDLFLPVGYPHSVRPEYMSYQIYDSLQGLCSYLRGVVATRALLTAAGVGDAEATAMSAAMTWAMRDGLGMIGGLVFSYTTSSFFDSYVKEFRLFADIVNDVGLTLDMLAPLAGQNHVLYVTSMGTICKVMCGISAGATKGSITQHLSLRGNMADLNAKEGTQETLMSLIGMILGVALARYLRSMEEHDKSLASAVCWTIFIVLTIVHVWANYVGVKLLRLRTLNRERASVVLQGIVECVAEQSFKAKQSESTDMYRIDSMPTPEQVSESLWSSTRTLLFRGRVRLGVNWVDLVNGLGSTEVVSTLTQEFGTDQYCLNIDKHRNVHVALRVGATDCDELKAFVHAMAVRQCLKHEKKAQTSTMDRTSVVSKTHFEINKLFPSAKGLNLMDEMEKKGWDIEHRLYLGYGRWRFQWSSAKTD